MRGETGITRTPCGGTNYPGASASQGPRSYNSRPLHGGESDSVSSFMPSSWLQLTPSYGGRIADEIAFVTHPVTPTHAPVRGDELSAEVFPVKPATPTHASFTGGEHETISPTLEKKNFNSRPRKGANLQFLVFRDFCDNFNSRPRVWANLLSASNENSSRSLNSHF